MNIVFSKPLIRLFCCPPTMYVYSISIYLFKLFIFLLRCCPYSTCTCSHNFVSIITKTNLLLFIVISFMTTIQTYLSFSSICILIYLKTILQCHLLVFNIYHSFISFIYLLYILLSRM